MRKVDVSCEKLRQGNFVLPCDDQCQLKADEKEKQEQAIREQKAAADEEQKRIDMEEFERKYGNRKPKERKQRQVAVEEGRNWTKIAIVALAVLIPIVGIVAFMVLQ